MPRFRIHKQSETEFTEARSWYSVHSSWAAENFDHAFFTAVDRLRLTPTGHAYWRQPFRRIRLKRFPYLLIYHADQKQVSLLALVHARREPRRAFSAMARRLSEFD